MEQYLLFYALSWLWTTTHSWEALITMIK